MKTIACSLALGCAVLLAILPQSAGARACTVNDPCALSETTPSCAAGDGSCALRDCRVALATQQLAGALYGKQELRLPPGWQPLARKLRRPQNFYLHVAQQGAINAQRYCSVRQLTDETIGHAGLLLRVPAGLEGELRQRLAQQISWQVLGLLSDGFYDTAGQARLHQLDRLSATPYCFSSRLRRDGQLSVRVWRQ